MKQKEIEEGKYSHRFGGRSHVDCYYRHLLRRSKRIAAPNMNLLLRRIGGH